MFAHKSTIIYPQLNKIEEAFPFQLIDGYDFLRIETFSVSLTFIKAFSTSGGPSNVELIYGKREMLLTDHVKTKASVMRKHSDSRLLKWLNDIEARESELYSALSQDRFRLWTSRSPSHKKMFLVERSSGERRAIVGSANASIPSVCGDIEECLVVFDGEQICDELFKRFEDKKSNSDRVDLAETLAWLETSQW